MDKLTPNYSDEYDMELAAEVGPGPACPCPGCRNASQTYHQIRVEQFMVAAGQEVPLQPTLPDKDTRLLRARLILEEALETVEALGVSVWNEHGERIKDIYDIEFFINSETLDMEKAVDGCADLSVVAIGTLSAMGVKDKPILEAVDQANLRKFKGDAHKDKSGKWVKPTGWQPPAIKSLLARQTPHKETIDAGLDQKS